jgi:WhiB family redox-sensing transcriptional regulator
MPSLQGLALDLKTPIRQFQQQFCKPGDELKFPKQLSTQQLELLAQLEVMRLPRVFDSAACVSQPAEIFGSSHPASVALAKRVCSTCPIKTACLEWALEHPEEGVWGGTTRQERELKVKQVSMTYVDELAERRAKRVRLLDQVGIADLAAEFQVTERTIHRWRAQIQNEAS